MNRNEFNKKKKEIDLIATEFNWIAISNDPECGRLSYSDELSIYRIDIYTSKMTVCILPKGSKAIYKKRLPYQKIKKIFQNPYKY